MSLLRPRASSARFRGAHAVFRGATPAVVVIAVLFGLAGTATAVPPPPPNPGDSQIDAAGADAQAKSNAVDGFVFQVTQAQGALSQVREQLAQRQELTNKALVDLQSAQDAVTAAGAAQTQAQLGMLAANGAVQQADQQGALFAVGSFQQGSTIGSFSAYMGSNSPQDLLDRVALLNAVGGSQLKVMATLASAHSQSVDADAAARQAKQRADDAAAHATAAKQTADDATEAARQAQQQQSGQVQALENQVNRAQYNLQNAQLNLSGLQGQRIAFDQWVVQRRLAEAAAAKEAADAVRNQIQAVGGSFGAAPASPTAQAVIQRAASALGIPYAWGGGNAAGPTLGIRDGGVADSYGDFAKVGFDCSGLMMYAFAGVGVGLPHYTGYQYQAGRQVPLGDLQPGDMVFYGPNASSHVALYVGSGKMIEAPQSGSYVIVSDLRLGGIMPNAVRMT